jgi:ribosomal protein S18 acetylase RimI-like enzyme
VTSSVEIRPATRDDLRAIERIQIDSRHAPAWEPLSYLDYDCRVACVGESEHVAGFIVSRDVAPRHVKSGQIEHAEREILSLAVDSANRRQGVARALVEAELRSAPKGTTWFLEVRESNLAAISLYTAVGFTASGRRPGYYHDPAEAAIVMRFFS